MNAARDREIERSSWGYRSASVLRLQFALRETAAAGLRAGLAGAVRSGGWLRFDRRRAAFIVQRWVVVALRTTHPIPYRRAYGTARSAVTARPMLCCRG